MITAYFYILSLRTEYPGLQDLVSITKFGRGELYYPERNKEQKIKEQVMTFYFAGWLKIHTALSTTGRLQSAGGDA